MKEKFYNYYLKIFIFICVFMLFSKENISAQEIPIENYYQKKIGNHFLIDFPNNPLLIDNKNKEAPENTPINDKLITTLQSITEDGNMRFSAIHKKNVKNNLTLAEFYQKEIKKSVLPVGGMFYEQQNIEIAHHKGVKFRVKFRKNATSKTHKEIHKEQTYMMFLVNEDYYLFAYFYEGFEKKPLRDMELHFFQSLQESK